MREYERTAILVEQCEDCRGIFLDHGELERLIDAEGGGWSGRIVPPSATVRTPVAAVHAPRPQHARDRGAGRRGDRLDNLRDLFGEK